MSTNNAATAGATVKTMITAMSAVNILRFKVVTPATNRADPVVYPGAPDTVTVPAGIHAGQAAEDFTSPMRGQSGLPTVFPAQAGTQVRGLEPHVTSRHPRPRSGRASGWSTPGPSVVYNPILTTPIARQILLCPRQYRSGPPPY